MTYTLLRVNELKTTTWSGGTTTELVIFPPEASYALRDFAWRLSTAVVTAPESTFTSLPDYNRLLMVLFGQMLLKHTGHHQSTLLPFEQDRFSGSWSTHCTGTGRDFNLMLGVGWQGRLCAIRLLGGDVGTPKLMPPEATHAFYCAAGQAMTVIADQTLMSIAEGDLLLLHQGPAAQPPIISAHVGSVDLIHAAIWQE